MPPTTVHRKRLSLLAPLVPLDGARRPVAVSPDRRVALFANAAVKVYASLDGALPESIPEQSWQCFGSGKAMAGEYSDHLRELPSVMTYYGYRQRLSDGWRDVTRVASLPAHRTGLRQTWSLSPGLLRHLAPVALAAAGDDYRPALAMVKLEPAEDGTLTAVACDGYRLHVRHRLPLPVAGAPTLVPGALIPVLLKADTPVITVDRLDSGAYRLDACDSAGALVIAATWSDTHTYPAWRQVIPRECPLSAGVFPADALLQQARHTANRINPNDPGSTPVWVAVFGDRGERRVTLAAAYLADAVHHLGRAPVTVTTPSVHHAPVVFDAADFQATIMPMFCKSIANG